MKRINGLSQVVLLVVCSALLAFGQSAATKDSNNLVPRLVRFSGTLTDANGKSLTSIAGVTFSLYKDSEGGSPLWIETQNVQLDSKGHYSVLLGSTKSTGVSSDLFASGDARWLGVQAEGQTEQPRVLMVSVPYALKAVDAETLGGKPASAYVTADMLAAGSSVNSHSATSQASPVSGNPVGSLKFGAPGAPPPCPPIAGGGALHFIPLWTPNGCKLGNSIMNQNTPTDVNVNGGLQLQVTGSGLSYPLNFITSAGEFGLQGQPTFGAHGHFNVLWNGVATGFYGRDDGGMAANFGTFNNTNPAPTSYGVSGTSVNSYGVSGTSVDPSAVSSGVYGLDQTASIIGAGSGGIGVWGDSAANIGLEGTSDTNIAILGLNNATGDPTSPTAYLENDATYLNTDVGCPSGSINTQNCPLLLDAYAPDYQPASGFGECIIDISGSLYCTGSKSAVVPVERGSHEVALYAVEAPDNWFEDFGSGQLSNGLAVVRLETTFAQTVNTGIDYHVFLTPKGDCKGLYVTNETSGSFEVREVGGGASDVAFDFRIVARRLGKEHIRFADMTKMFRKHPARAGMKAERRGSVSLPAHTPVAGVVRSNVPPLPRAGMIEASSR